MRKTISESSALLKIWNHKKNKSLSPDTTTLGTHQKVWWICKKNHEWNTLARTANKTGCPYCAGRIASPENNLSSLYPKLTKEWHPSKNDNLSPNMVLSTTAKKAWWVCKKGHEWEASIRRRTQPNKPTGCPYCAGRIASPENNFAFLYPEKARQWHPSKNGINLPNMFTAGSHKKAWWICKKGHEWEAAFYTRRIRGCPKCTNQSSEPEIRILAEFKAIFSDVLSRYKVDSIELDIFIPSFQIGIEYDGYYYHKNKKDKDRDKNIAIESKGIMLFRLRQAPLVPISSIDIIHDKQILTKKIIDKLLLNLKPFVDKKHSKLIDNYKDKSDFVNHELFNLYMSYFPDPFPENSLELLFPEVSKEWNYGKNKPLIPSNFSKGSGKRVWWKCKKGHEWQATIDTRTDSKHPTKCPYCAGRKIASDNNLSALYPALAKQWHPSKNGINLPDMFTAGSTKKAWWICKKGHEWEAVIYSRKTRGCPFCSGKRASPENNIEFLFPEVAKQWHPSKNKELLPNMFSYGSDSKAWWLCDKGHEWEAVINSRRTRGCPHCRKR